LPPQDGLWRDSSGGPRAAPLAWFYQPTLTETTSGMGRSREALLP